MVRGHTHYPGDPAVARLQGLFFMQKITTSILFFSLVLTACKDQIPLPPASAGTVPSVASQWGVEAQFAKWKQELVADRQIGDVCPTESISDQTAVWRDKYPFAADAWSAASSFATADFNGDKKNDLLMYFQSTNCSGHNGASPMFAKIVYSDGSSSRTNLMVDIRDAIFKEYDAMRKKDKQLVEVYRDTTTIGKEVFLGRSDFDETTIDYHFGIRGQVSLYAKDSSLTPCARCAYYTGEYRYEPLSKKATLKVTRRAY